MGRCLNWKIKPKSGEFTIEDLRMMHDISVGAQGMCEWTCETFELEPGIYPNWARFSEPDKATKGWDAINKRFAELKKTGMHPVDADMQLVAEGLALMYRPEWRREIGGFCKVGGNELNAMVITATLVLVSKKMICTITLSDEGKYLRCPVVIEDGKARPDEEGIRDSISHLLTLKWNDNYNKDKKFLARVEAEARELYDIEKAHHSRYYPPRCEWDIAEFTRPVNPKDFEQHPEYGASQIMSGFYGEYFGLSDKDAEAESFRMIGSLQKMISAAAGDEAKNLRMEVAPRIKTKNNPRAKRWMGSSTCDFCHIDLHKVPWFVDGNTSWGSWAVMCNRCFPQHGVGLGEGRGQKYDGRTFEMIAGDRARGTSRVAKIARLRGFNKFLEEN